nr:hypothetical protein [Mesorhizobium sp.]
MILRPDVDVGDGRRAAIPPPRDRFVGRVSREKRHDQYSGLAGGLDESLPRKTARLLALQHGDEGFAGLLVARPPFRRPDAEKTLGRRSGGRRPPSPTRTSLFQRFASKSPAKSFPQFANGLERILQMVRPSPACRIRGENADHS